MLLEFRIHYFKAKFEGVFSKVNMYKLCWIYISYMYENPAEAGFCM